MSDKVPCESCDGRNQRCKKSLRCQACLTAHRRADGSKSPHWRGGKTTGPDGYVVLSGQWDHPNMYGRGRLLEHTKVMTAHIGRGLLAHEQVHHKNGVRNDNSLENLELWTTSQPAGSRVEDKISWAFQLLREYGLL